MLIQKRKKFLEQEIFEVPISSLIEYLQKVQGEYGETASLKFLQYGVPSSVEIALYAFRPETEAEERRRIIEETKSRRIQNKTLKNKTKSE